MKAVDKNIRLFDPFILTATFLVTLFVFLHSLFFSTPFDVCSFADDLTSDFIPNQQTVIRFASENSMYYDPEDGRLPILSYFCEFPYIVMEGKTEVADRINSMLSTYHSDYIQSADGIGVDMDLQTYLLSLAEDYYSLHRDKTGEDNYLFSFSHRCTVARCDGTVLVLRFSDYLDDVQSVDLSSRTLCFDLTTGDQISELLASDSRKYPAVQSTQDGEIEIFAEEVFASEEFSFCGNRADAFAVTDFIETDTDGNQYYICISGDIRNIRLSSVVYYDKLYEKQQLWYCSRMCNEALQLKISVPAEKPVLKLSYESGGTGIEKVIRLGTDGVFLSDP